jgi:hypothetical protein
MSTTNEIWLTVNGHRARLDLDSDTQLLPSFQANDRTRPNTIQSDYSPEFSVPGTANNHRLLQHAVASQATRDGAYKRVPCLLTSGGVETLPLAILYLKGYSEGRIYLQLVGGNRRLVEALGDKKLSDLDLSRFDHDWTPANILAGLPFEVWQQRGWGYEVYDRGKPVDLQNLDPYTLYPSCSANLVWQQILTDAGFTADSLRQNPLWAALNVPSATPYTFSAEFREARQLKSGFEHAGQWIRYDEFQEQAPFNFVKRKPFRAGKALDISAGVNQYVVPTLGYYDLDITAAVYLACNPLPAGEVSMKLLLRVNGQPLLNEDGTEVKGEVRVGKPTTTTLTAAKKRVLLKAGDVLDVLVQGDKWDGAFGIGPSNPTWIFGTRSYTAGPGFEPKAAVEPAVSFSVDLTEEFPPGGRVHLSEWLPDMKQLDFVKAMMLTLGLTIQVDQYRPHLRLATGDKLLANVSRAKDWTAKRDAAHRPGRLPERALSFRFGEYGQANYLKWAEDDTVTEGYGDGTLLVADEVLQKEYELATLPFAATEGSQAVLTMLRILNFETEDELAQPVVYSKVSAKPRLVLREAEPAFACQLITTAAVLDSSGQVTTPARLSRAYTTASYFDGSDLSLMLNETVLTAYWADLRAMLDRSRYLTERYRLTPQDIAELDFSVPIWDALLGDFFAVSQISEYDARRSVEVKLCRLNAAHLEAPRLPRGEGEFYTLEEFYGGEFY